ncbi:NAD(P)H-flavin reductase [Vibrio porteresiae]|uniref:NAD(P)H-flavin reductase n=1 Tax=Vibrio porteresiae DSM 19223 TaxID=1123496 RepID=A0ABZ0QDS5_9VIBR|nr:NAD(P)H-flavin reductase [Vibrio porteresiae]WPC74357.1 NAD(P)H-flavin reductase [Vibrio porteresiae DSM 19223]
MIVNCKVKSIDALASNTYKILLQPESTVTFKAGQYLMVVMGLKDKRPFSIANSPTRAGELELHIGAAEHNAYAGEVVEKMRNALTTQDSVEIDVPHGKASLQESERPLLLIAGGTGFSYVRSILDDVIAHQWSQPTYLYWGAKDKSQLYAFDELVALASTHANIHFVPVVEHQDESWTGKVGNVLQAVSQDFATLEEFDIYLAGRFEMAGAARDQFVLNKQANSDRMFADAYAFI